MRIAMNACIRRRCNWISSPKYLAGAKRQSTDRERACPGDALFLSARDSPTIWTQKNGAFERRRLL